MSENIIVCTTDDAQDVELDALASEIGITRAELFQRFWDGYTAEGVTMTGSVKGQVDQWLTDRLKARLATMSAADALALLQG